MPKKFVEVALPLNAIDGAVAHEESSHNGAPRCCTSGGRGVRSPPPTRCCLLGFLTPRTPTTELANDRSAQGRERKRLVRLIERMIPWDASCHETGTTAAQSQIEQSHGRVHSNVPRTAVILSEVWPATVVNERLAALVLCARLARGRSELAWQRMLEG